MGHCIDSVCQNSVSFMLSEFELGYEHPEATRFVSVQQVILGGVEANI